MVVPVVAKVRNGVPLPLVVAPPNSVPVSAGVDLLEGDEGGVVFLWGMATWSWSAEDTTTRRLAAVQLVESSSASQRCVAEAFDVDETTLWRWRRDFRGGGVAALAPLDKGPKRASKLTDAKIAEIVAARATGVSMAAIAIQVGVSLNSVSRALKPAARPRPASGHLDAKITEDSNDNEVETGDGAVSDLVPLARPEPRTIERQAARAGALVEARPAITEGASLPLAGALVILPALAATGLVEVASSVYTTTRPAFYGLRSLLLAVVFAALVGEARAEGLTRIDPVDLGRLLGLDRAPEAHTLRRRMQRLAEEGRSPRLFEALARHHVQANAEAAGIFYVDGHVRAYHGNAKLRKAHVARMRISMPAAADTWVCDSRGGGVLVWSEEACTSLVGELRRAAKEIRALVGPDARPMIIFDRGGWSPVLFAELVKDGFDITTYRKGPKPVERRSSFTDHRFVEETGRRHDYLLADRNVRIPYDAKRRYFACRQITRLKDGHQTHFLTTRTDPDPAPLGHAMFSRWRQENFFRYMRSRFDLDGLDTYANALDDPERSVPNPAKKAAGVRAKAVAAELVQVEARLAEVRSPELAAGVSEARDYVEGLKKSAKDTPARVPLGQLHPDAQVLNPERKRIHDAIRMATYNAESILARLLRPHFAKAHDEARTLLREIYSSPADLQIVGTQLHVRINALSAPRRSRALAGLCAELTETETTYPGTNLVLVYTVKGH